MNGVASLIFSRAGETILFTAIIVFTVTSLAIFGESLERGMSRARARTVAFVLAIIFSAMATGGGASYLIASELHFLNLAFFLTGAAGTGILLSLMLHRSSEAEMRRIAALDL